VVEFNHVTKVYDGNIVSVDDVSFKIEKGEFVFLIGPSGSGKTTIIKTLIRDELPSEGKIFFDDVDITKINRRKVYKLRREIGVIFQDFKLVPDKTAYENVSFAMEAAGKTTKEIKETVPYVLDIVGLANRMDSFPRQLSGGEQQRVAIARAIANNPKILIADEPTGNLDPASAWDIVQVLTKINNWGTTVIMSTHGTDIVNSLNKRVIQMEKGKIIRDDNKGQYEMISIFEKNILDPEKTEKKEKKKGKKTYQVKLEENPEEIIEQQPEIIKQGRFARIFNRFKQKHETSEGITDILDKPTAELYTEIENPEIEKLTDKSEAQEVSEISTEEKKSEMNMKEILESSDEPVLNKTESEKSEVETPKTSEEKKEESIEETINESETQDSEDKSEIKKNGKFKKDLTWSEEEVNVFLENSKSMKVDNLDLPKAVIKDLKAAGYKEVTSIIEAGPDKLAQSLLIDPEEIVLVSKAIKALISSTN